MNNTFIKLSLAFTCIGHFTFAHGADVKKDSTKLSPNVIIMIADDISRNDIGCYGNPVIKTPNIDWLAHYGIRFTNVFLTTSSCSPSRVSIITGRYPHNTGACELHSALPNNQVLFPKILKDAGYYTAQAGKWHFGSSPLTPKGPALETFDRTGGSVIDGGGDSGAKKWVQYLVERPKNKPFFMWFASHDAHRGWDNSIFLKKYLAKDVIVPPYLVDNKKTRTDIASYYNEVSRFDYYVGEVVKELKKQNVLENTCIIIMADNGRPFPRDKTRLYDSGIKTPFIVYWPSGIRSTNWVCNSLVSAVDIAPTVVDIAGGKESDTFQGESFLRLLDNPDQDFRKLVFAEHNWHDFKAFERMVHTDKFLLIENGLPNLSQMGAIDVMTGGAGQELVKANSKNRLNNTQKGIFLVPQPSVELYDCMIDSLQFNDLSNDPHHAKIKKELLSKLHEWEITTHDSKPSYLTPDWYSRIDFSPLPVKGQRGEMPGNNKHAETVITHDQDTCF